MTSDPSLWNAGTEDVPEKGKNDPCPAGWRVLTKKETDKMKDKLKYDGKTTVAIEGSEIKLAAVGYLLVPSIDWVSLSSFSTNLALSTSLSEDDKKAVVLSCGTDGNSYLPYGKIRAIPVRCVQE